MKENFSKGHKYRTKEGEVIVILKIDNDFKRIRYKYLNDGPSSENPDTYPFWSFSEWNSGSYEDLSGTVIVGVNNLAMGETTGEGIYDLGTEITIEAKAYEGNQFYKWDDGNLDNPRTIKVTDNLKFVAIFEGKSEGKPEFSEVEIVVKSDDENKGTTRGSGKYTKGAEVELIAIAKEGFVFTHWDDGNKENPCCVIVSKDAEYTAFFEALSTPNENYTKQHEQFEKEKNSLNQQLETAHNTFEELKTRQDKHKLSLTVLLVLLVVFGLATFGLALMYMYSQQEVSTLYKQFNEKSTQCQQFEKENKGFIKNQRHLNDSIKELNLIINEERPIYIHKIEIDTNTLIPKITYTGYREETVILSIRIYIIRDDGRLENATYPPYMEKVIVKKGDYIFLYLETINDKIHNRSKNGNYQIDVSYKGSILRKVELKNVNNDKLRNVNDKAWNKRKAMENYDNMDRHMKLAEEAAKRNDSIAAKDHTDSAKMYKAKGDEYMDAAKRSTK